MKENVLNCLEMESNNLTSSTLQKFVFYKISFILQFFASQPLRGSEAPICKIENTAVNICNRTDVNEQNH